MRGRRSVVEDYGKESIDGSEIFTHSSQFVHSQFVLSGKASVLLDTVCYAHFTA